MKRCPGCQAEVPDGFPYCDHCGREIPRGDSGESTIEVPPPVPRRVTPPPLPGAPPQAPGEAPPACPGSGPVTPPPLPAVDPEADTAVFRRPGPVAGPGEEVTPELGTPPVAGGSPGGGDRRGGGRGPLPLVASLAGLMLLAVLAGGWWWFQQRRSGDASPVEVVVVTEDEGPAPAPRTPAGGVGTAAEPAAREKPGEVVPQPSTRPMGRKKGARARPTPRPRQGLGVLRLQGVPPDEGSALSALLPPGAVLFAKKNYRGRSQRFTGDQVHLGGTRIRDNAATSLRVEGGAVVLLCTKPNFGGRTLEFREDCPHLGKTRLKNNRVSSLRVSRPKLGSVLRAKTFTVAGNRWRVELRANGVEMQSAEGGARYFLPRGTGTGPVPVRWWFRALLDTNPRLADRLGPAVSRAFRLMGGGAVQLFDGGVLLVDAGAGEAYFLLR